MTNTELSLPKTSPLSSFLDFFNNPSSFDNPTSFYELAGKDDKRAEFLASFQMVRDKIVSDLSQALNGGEELSSDFIAFLIHVKGLFIQLLTLLEDDFYRNRQPKSVLRSALFNLTKMAGSTIVPGESVGFTPIIDTPFADKQWGVLDYRKTGKPEDKQRGEILEAIYAFKQSAENSHQDWLLAMEELGDVLFNNAQTLGINNILEKLASGKEAGSDKKNNELFMFGLYLLQLAEFKFEHRYFLKLGVKEEDSEKEYITRGQEALHVNLEQVFLKYGHLIPEMLLRLTDINREIVEAKVAPLLEGDDLQLFMSELVSTETIRELLNLPSAVQ